MNSSSVGAFGAPEAIAKVFLLFQMRYDQRLKYRPIARQLNDEGILSTMGLEWTTATVRAILLNPIYIGLAVRYRTTRGIYVKGGSTTGEPEPSDVTPEELDQNAHVRVRRRERGKWRELPEEQFRTFLPDNIYDAARAATNQHLARIADGKPLREINRDPHTQSLYILKNILRCKETGFPMKGRLSGKKGKQVRKYGISKGAHIPRSNGPSSKRVSAEPIESSVMALVRQAVLDRPRMVDAMNKVLARAEKAEKCDRCGS